MLYSSAMATDAFEQIHVALCLHLFLVLITFDKIVAGYCGFTLDVRCLSVVRQSHVRPFSFPDDNLSKL